MPESNKLQIDVAVAYLSTIDFSHSIKNSIIYLAQAVLLRYMGVASMGKLRQRTGIYGDVQVII